MATVGHNDHGAVRGERSHRLGELLLEQAHKLRLDLRGQAGGKHIGGAGHEHHQGPGAKRGSGAHLRGHGGDVEALGVTRRVGHLAREEAAEALEALAIAGRLGRQGGQGALPPVLVDGLGQDEADHSVGVVCGEAARKEAAKRVAHQDVGARHASGGQERAQVGRGAGCVTRGRAGVAHAEASAVVATDAGVAGGGGLHLLPRRVVGGESGL